MGHEAYNKKEEKHYVTYLVILTLPPPTSPVCLLHTPIEPVYRDILRIFIDHPLDPIFFNQTVWKKKLE